VLHAARWKCRAQKIDKNSPSAHHRTTLSSYISATKACVDNQKNMLNSSMSSIRSCPHNMVNFGPLTAEIGSGVWGHPSKFQRVSRLAFVTAATSLTGSQPNCTMFGRLLGWYTISLYIFGGSCPLPEFCSVQYSLCIQVLRSPILAALLHNTPAAGVSQTFRRGTRNEIIEVSRRAPPIFGRAGITSGIGPHSGLFVVFFFTRFFLGGGGSVR